jgi:hypothetical protein
MPQATTNAVVIAAISVTLYPMCFTPDLNSTARLCPDCLNPFMQRDAALL